MSRLSLKKKGSLNDPKEYGYSEENEYEEKFFYTKELCNDIQVSEE
jgi:hypothetical protein